MSWFRSLAAPFQAEEGQATVKEEEEEPNEHGRGVKEDLSELRKTFTRQLWGVASFLAPPPATKYEPPENNNNNDEQNLQTEEEPDGQTSPEGSGQTLPEGIRSDLSELTGRVKTGFSRISSVIHSVGKDESDESHSESEDGNKIGKAMNFPGTFASGINEISRLASSFMPFNQEVDLEDSEIFRGEESRAVGVTEEVLTFATNIAKHPETWLDFPIFSDDEDGEDFDMSDVQQEHALAVERLAPRLAALRIELCPGYMSEGQFWKIYFVLLHSRLGKQDALLLSTPQIVEARRLLMQELQKRNKTESSNIGVSNCPEGKSLLMTQEEKFGHFSPLVDNSEKAESFKIVSLQAATPVAAEEFKSDYQLSSQTTSFNGLVASEEPLIQNKDVLARTMKLSDVKHDDEDADADDWLQEEPAGTDVPLRTGTGLGNEDDVSFSDLEDEDDTEVKTTSERVKGIQNSTPKGSKGWVQLGKGSNELEGHLINSDAFKQEPIRSYPGSKSETQLLSDSSQEGSVEQLSRNSERGESNDWLTVEEEDAF